MSRAPSEDAELDGVLAEDAAGVCSSMDAETLADYRAAVRELARWSRRPSTEVARAAVEFAARTAERGDPAAHLGHALLGERRPAFEAHLGCRVPARERVARLGERCALGAYVAAVVGISAGASIELERVLASQGAGWRGLVISSLVAIPALWVTARIVDLALWASPRSKRRFPRLAPTSAPLSRHRTVVVMPVIVGSPAEVESILRTIEVSHAGNSDPALTWAILTDCRDGPAQDDPADAAIIEAASRGVAALNERHCAGATRFHHFHRARRWNDNAGVWMGWERKRGKLGEFSALILGSDDTSFRSDIGDVSAVRGACYVITLDADSRLTKHAARDLVATAAHPLNRPRFAEGEDVVEAGYAIWQPTLDSRTRAEGIWGRARLRFAPPDDRRVFKFGRFLGKGLYDVAAFARALRNRIPENAVLSHDNLEGWFAATATHDEVQVVEAEPSDVSAFARRLHRWTRGDWQLLPWLLPWVRGEDGRWHRNALGLLPRWWIVRLLLTSLRPVALVAIVALAWCADRVGPAWIYSAALVAYLVLDPAVLVPGAVLARALVSGSAAGPRLAWSVARQMRGNIVVDVVLQPLVAWVTIDAVVRTLYRLFVSGRRLLEWTTSAHAERASRSGVVAALRDGRGMFLLVGVIAACVIRFHPRALPAAAPLLALWLSSPLLLSPRVRRPRP